MDEWWLRLIMAVVFGAVGVGWLLSSAVRSGPPRPGDPDYRYNRYPTGGPEDRAQN
jgi:hypothetical protein